MAGPIIWNSLLIQQTLDKLRMGITTNLSAFHESDIELKAANILYQLTPEEIDEFHKCSEDIVYFVEKYCRFLTDAGRRTVKLREFQSRILKALEKEEYSEKWEQLIPTNRNMIMMQARQSGKCFFDGTIVLEYPSGELYKVPVNIFYYMIKEKLTLLEKIKVKLMLIYHKL